MEHILIIILCTVLVSAACGMHYEALKLVSVFLRQISVPRRSRTLVVVAAMMIAHVLQISLYALAYWASNRTFDLAGLTGATEGNISDYFYFSITTFTTLGVGDVVMEGPMRMLAGIQSLNGLVLIAWSASFTFISMQRFWQD